MYIVKYIVITHCALKTTDMWIASAKLLVLRAFAPDEEAPLMTGRMPKKVRFLDGEVGLFGRARDSWQVGDVVTLYFKISDTVTQNGIAMEIDGVFLG